MTITVDTYIGSADPRRSELYRELRTLADGVAIPEVSDVAISEHTLQRYRERVDSVPRCRARRRIEQLLDRPIEWRPRPRAWTTVVLHDGVVYGYPLHRPDICLLVRNSVVVTVLSMRFCRSRARCAPPAHRGRSRVSGLTAGSTRALHPQRPITRTSVHDQEFA